MDVMPRFKSCQWHGLLGCCESENPTTVAPSSLSQSASHEPLKPVCPVSNTVLHAAKHNEVYHLWWHPHNFGVNQQENFEFLSKILKHYSALKAQYGFESMTMSDLSGMLQQTDASA